MLRALFALEEPGAFSPVVEAPDGFYIIKLFRHRPASLMPWTEARERIRYRLAVKKEAERERKFYEANKAGLRIQVKRELVEAIRQQLRTNGPGVKPDSGGR